MGEIKECGLCGGTDLVPVLDMGSQPLAERYGADERYPLAVAGCGDCTLLQLTYAPDRWDVFPLDHPYASGDTLALREHFAALAERIGVRGPVVDIGANDGTLLAAFSPKVDRIAVEPTGQVDKCREKGLTVYQGFFSSGMASTIRRIHGPAQVVTACNVLAHVPDVHDFTAGVAWLLDDDGVFVAEVHDAAAITEGLQIDAVYHEHLRYFTVATVSRLLAAHGLQIDQIERIPTHGGSLRVWARKRHRGVQARADAAAQALRDMLARIHGAGIPVYGVGATTRATGLIHFAGIADHIACVCEVPGSAKIGHTIPGTRIPIVDEAALLQDQPPYALLLSWHLADRLILALRRKGYLGRFIVPLPDPRILDG